jgi:pimeloyl-ACP methyl ester carboxylesterase
LDTKPCTVKTKSGRYAAECGNLVVPEKRGKMGSRKISLPVKRIHATGQSPAEPIFYLTGGPGMSNMGFKPPAELLAQHDVVLVGYRGVDGSAVLDCPAMQRAMKGVGKDLLGPESLASLARAAREDSQRLQGQGFDLDGYTILEVIGDLEAARTAFGYERINLLSESYGTRIAQIYAWQHPERIHRSAQIGVNPPGRFIWEPGMIDKQLAYDARLWAQDPLRNARSPDLAETVRRVSHQMPGRWLILPIDPGKVKAVAFVMLFNRNTAAMVYDAFVAAGQGDPSGLALMSLVYDIAVPSLFTWGDFLSKGLSADYDDGRNYAAELNPPGSIMGSPLSYIFWGSGLSWPAKKVPVAYRQAQPCDVETLLVSGSNDFSTPAEYAAQELLPTLSRGYQVVLAEMGHVGDLWGMQPEATHHLLANFYDAGRVDDSRFHYQPMDFKVRWGFPKLAKIAAGTVVLIILAVVAALALAARVLA